MATSSTSEEIRTRSSRLVRPSEKLRQQGLCPPERSATILRPNKISEEPEPAPSVPRKRKELKDKGNRHGQGRVSVEEVQCLPFFSGLTRSAGWHGRSN